jgi:putative MATE family efflux protein
VVLAAICALVMLVIAQCMVTPALRILQSPDEVVPMATVYLRIIYCGIPVIMTYNMTSSILRALGDGQTPLYAMIVASLTNIALDMLFVLVFGWGVAGAAVATVIAQILASVYCILTIRKIEILKLERKDFSLDADMDKRLCILAAPMAFQNGIIAVGGMIVQTVVNGFGVAFIAGFTATNKLYGVLEVAATSYGFAMTTYTGQNMGAGQTKRISQGIRAGLLIGIGTSIVITTVLMITGKWILGCFISVEEAGGTEAMEVAWEYLRYMIIFLPILYVLHVVRSCIQGMGNTVIPMVSGISEFCMRTGSAFLMPLLMGERGLMFAEIIAWAGADLILIPGYLHERKKLQ